MKKIFDLLDLIEWKATGYATANSVLTLLTILICFTVGAVSFFQVIWLEYLVTGAIADNSYVGLGIYSIAAGLIVTIAVCGFWSLRDVTKTPICFDDYTTKIIDFIPTYKRLLFFGNAIAWVCWVTGVLLFLLGALTVIVFCTCVKTKTPIPSEP